MNKPYASVANQIMKAASAGEGHRTGDGVACFLGPTPLPPPSQAGAGTRKHGAPTSLASPVHPIRLLGHLGNLPFLCLHLACLAVFSVPPTPLSVVLCAGLSFVRMFGITAGYHRYFSHRSYKTSRWFQFVLALLATTAAQKGVLWWAAHHRHHHRHSDKPTDLHSPKQHG